jgi:DNA-directed RNA polymerase specialized sigma24 family protein
MPYDEDENGCRVWNDAARKRQAKREAAPRRGRAKDDKEGYCKVEIVPGLWATVTEAALDVILRHDAKLTPDELHAQRRADIAQAYLAGGTTYEKVGDRFGISRVRVWQIVRRYRRETAAASDTVVYEEKT